MTIVKAPDAGASSNERACARAIPVRAYENEPQRQPGSIRLRRSPDRIAVIFAFVNFRARRGALALALPLAVAACAARGPLYGEDEAARTVVPIDRAHVVVYRTKASTQYSAAWAAVSIDGNDVGTVEWGGYAAFTTTPGPHVIASHALASSVSCPIEVDLVAGSRSFFEVAPRAADYWGHLPSMFIGAIIPLAGIPLFYLEEKAQGHEHECLGGFAITAIDAPRALDTLAKLRASKTAPIEAKAPFR